MDHPILKYNKYDFLCFPFPSFHGYLYLLLLKSSEHSKDDLTVTSQLNPLMVPNLEI